MRNECITFLIFSIGINRALSTLLAQLALMSSHMVG